eukprot:CAMPEP_0170470934 /NCGR_PEP_ID=MMETSP0123-20130129/13265_1 /TAXON_ID=182087 /ORGANISM="Favella ehrenbergii, Strain Fehren 1" /LENGTH=83 /DNA_ID=CAMNT_0010738301 /DNA_START=478 /DNA_END=729 /DNA_ORIENTATION=-
MGEVPAESSSLDLSSRTEVPRDEIRARLRGPSRGPGSRGRLLLGEDAARKVDAKLVRGNRCSYEASEDSERVEETSNVTQPLQ